MKIKIIKDIVCSDALVCAAAIQAKIKTKIPSFFDVNGDQMGYVYIQHIQHNHIIYIILYDNDNSHEVLNSQELKSNHTSDLLDLPLIIESIPNHKKLISKPTKSELEAII